MPEVALLNWTLTQILTMVIILTRVAPLLFFMPVIGSTTVPAQIKILLALMTALVLTPVIQVNPRLISGPPLGFVVLVLREILLGATLAVFARCVFAAAEIAGQMVGIQMGMGMAGVMDPQFGTQVSLVGMLWNLTAILIFLGINGHHMFFSTLVESFEWIKPGGAILTKATFEGLMQGASHMFVLAVKIMAPAGAALFFSHVAMGIVAKTVPQIPIMIVGLPINLAVGFIFAGLSLAYLMPLMIANFEMLARLLPRLAQGMGG
ncbi:flagellar biosynthetic protein FliR [Thiovibrio frasassiensis]|uniref:Flagellar biosynthetic protein FliR n=1 Tax=Thiovibrio frasassiensis TaxID=2984131 RepID=A0A9X4RKS9_9BACT|nr:flagellar biosynthetic protein FliR [Thiovibrio frasassiensis]MDG4474860.1 flagellar biosynthetic protein FliR [Thiovibrio frasassiensis]